MHLIATDKRGPSALEFYKRSDLGYWKTYTMIQRILKAMRDCDADYKMDGIIEIYYSFFGRSKEAGDKWGRSGSKNRVIVEGSPNGEGVGYDKMIIVKSFDSLTIEVLIKYYIKEKQAVKTDSFRAYNIIAKTPHNHKREVIREKKLMK